MPEFHFKVHPFADTFPILADDELLELAQDITRNGLRYPIMLDHTGEWLLDGRNRIRACALAGIEPRFDRLPESADPIAYIISVNIERRHLTKGQQAVALVLARPEPGRGGRGQKLFQNTTVLRSDLSRAREIVAHADLAQLVMAGTVPFDNALNQARWRVKNATSMGEILRWFQAEAPDLADAVAAERMSLYDATMEQERRERAAKADLKEVREKALQYLLGLRTVWIARLRADEGFRAGLIDRLKIEPAQVGAMLQAIDQIMGVPNA